MVDYFNGSISQVLLKINYIDNRYCLVLKKLEGLLHEKETCKFINANYNNFFYYLSLLLWYR